MLSSRKMHAAGDELLVARIQRGQLDALSELFRKYAKSVRNIGARILHDVMEADDLVQEVFLYLQRKSELFDASKGTARSWIFQIAYSQALLRRRYLKVRGFYAVDSVGREELRSDGSAFPSNDWESMLGLLSDPQRETLFLHFVEGYTFREIAEKLGQSYANVRNHYYRGLEKLRQQLAPKASD